VLCTPLAARDRASARTRCGGDRRSTAGVTGHPIRTGWRVKRFEPWKASADRFAQPDYLEAEHLLIEPARLLQVDRGAGPFAPRAGEQDRPVSSVGDRPVQRPSQLPPGTLPTYGSDTHDPAAWPHARRPGDRVLPTSWMSTLGIEDPGRCATIDYQLPRCLWDVHGLVATSDAVTQIGDRTCHDCLRDFLQELTYESTRRQCCRWDAGQA
jgi:hypothetical protein